MQIYIARGWTVKTAQHSGEAKHLSHVIRLLRARKHNTACTHGRCRARTCDLLLVRRVRRLPLVAVSCCYLTNPAFSRRLRAQQLPLVATACFQIVSRSLAVSPPESGTAYAGSVRRAA